MGVGAGLYMHDVVVQTFTFAEFGRFRGSLRKSRWRCRRKKSSRSLSHLLMSSCYYGRPI